MKQLMMALMLLMSVGFSRCAGNATVSENEQPKSETEALVIDLPFKLYPTENMWTFIKLDTRNGQMWQVQYTIKDDDDYRFETPLSMAALATGQTAGRFELYPTKNMYNFILLDRVGGGTWQVQWSGDPENRGIVPISQPTL